MTEEQKNLLLSLLSDPFENKVDHILVMNDLYFQWSTEKQEFLKPLVEYYVTGIDDCPALSQRKLWNIKKYDEARKIFTDSHEELKVIVNGILNIENET